ncbi:Oar protein [plant metagenome]
MYSQPRRLRRAVLPFALIAALAATSPALGQSNATGTIYGVTGDPTTSVVVENTQTGQVRTIRPDAQGRYRAASLPVGKYRVLLQRDGTTIASQDEVNVLLGGGSEISFTAAQTLDVVNVTASAVPQIDVSQTDSRQVFTAEQLENLSVGRDIAALALLTPGAVAGDSRYQGARGFSDVAAFGGSSASENAYYINGYAVTNPYTALGSTSLPFGGIAQYQAITGGYSAEFGRATGGVVNIITERGTNDWRFGGQVVWNPDAGRASRRSIYYPEGTSSPNAGRIYQDRETHYENEAVTYAAYAGGPIVKDRLFFYAAGEVTRQDVQGLSVGTSGWSSGTNGLQDYDYKIPRWLAKLDWQINDYNLLEVTAISDVTKNKERYTRYNFTTG